MPGRTTLQLTLVHVGSSHHRTQKSCSFCLTALILSPGKTPDFRHPGSLVGGGGSADHPFPWRLVHRTLRAPLVAQMAFKLSFFFFFLIKGAETSLPRVSYQKPQSHERNNKKAAMPGAGGEGSSPWFCPFLISESEPLEFHGAESKNSWSQPKPTNV